jgi:acyl-CoA thioester hydrolase
VNPVYTASVAVRHDELDRFGRVQPAVYLRYLAHAAVEASAAAGYDPEWYARAGAMWLIRRSTFEVVRPATLGERLAVRTWVEDFRRVRSHRRYEIRGADGTLRVTARTDWVYVDAASGRPRRVPLEMEADFGSGAGRAQEREAWRAPPAPPSAAAATHRVRAYEVDSVGHVNNAIYLDLLGQAVLDALEDVGWSLDRLTAEGVVPVLARGDLEYLDAARYGDALVLKTWFAPSLGTAEAAQALDAHQLVGRRGGAAREVRRDTPPEMRPLVRAATRWRFADSSGATSLPLPAAILTALRPLLAA